MVPRRFELEQWRTRWRALVDTLVDLVVDYGDAQAEVARTLVRDSLCAFADAYHTEQQGWVAKDGNNPGLRYDNVHLYGAAAPRVPEVAPPAAAAAARPVAAPGESPVEGQDALQQLVRLLQQRSASIPLCRTALEVLTDGTGHRSLSTPELLMLLGVVLPSGAPLPCVYVRPDTGERLSWFVCRGTDGRWYSVLSEMQRAQAVSTLAWRQETAGDSLLRLLNLLHRIRSDGNVKELGESKLADIVLRFLERARHAHGPDWEKRRRRLYEANFWEKRGPANATGLLDIYDNSATFTTWS